MKTIVFVCTGNTCRSPMAEGMFRTLLAERGVSDVAVTSCGIGVFPGMPASAPAVRAAASYGADISAHRSRPLTQYLLDEGDLFVCMTEQHYALLSEHLPAEKLRLLVPGGVCDPYGGTDAEYDACAAQIYESLQSLSNEV